MAIPQAVERWLLEMEQEANDSIRKAEATLAAIRTLREFHAGQEPQLPAASTDEIIAGVKAILGLYGEPVHRDRILADLALEGIVVGGKNPVNNLGAILSRTSAFKSYGNGIWGLRNPAPVFSTKVSDFVAETNNNHTDNAFEPLEQLVT